MLKTMTLLALVMLTSAAPTGTEISTDGHKDKRELWWWKPDTCSLAKKPVFPKWNGDLTAYICTPDITAVVTAHETGPGLATWQVKVEDINPHICPTDLNWHIHELRIAISGDDAGTCGTTGGHTDDSFACGGASNWRKTTCNGLDSDWVADYGTRCKWNKDDEIAEGKGKDKDGNVVPVGQSGCEYGDLSGKMGQIERKIGTQTFKDKFIQPLDRYRYSSVVFHCGSPRIACGDFEYDR
jgi:hypothetical protein